MAAQYVDIQRRCNEACNEALDYIRKTDPQEYAKLDQNPLTKNEVMEEAKSTVTEYARLEAEVKGLPEGRIAERCLKYLSKERIELIKAGLSIPTFQLDVTKKYYETYYSVNLIRGGKPFMELGTRVLTAIADVDMAKVWQYSSILIETVMLFLSAWGIKVRVDDMAMEKTVAEAAEKVQSSSFLQRVIDGLIEAWKEAGTGDTKRKRASSLFQFIKTVWTNGGNILWTIIKDLYRSINWLDRIKIAVKAIAMFIVIVGSNGFALIGQIVLALDSVYEFEKKISIIAQLDEIRKTM